MPSVVWVALLRTCAMPMIDEFKVLTLPRPRMLVFMPLVKLAVSHETHRKSMEDI